MSATYLAQINLPVCDNAGHPNHKALGRLANLLRKNFGGYTVLRGVGSWLDEHGELYQEDVNVFQVAMTNTIEHDNQLRGIAREVGKLAHQKCMFIVLSSGEVEFINIEENTLL